MSDSFEDYPPARAFTDMMTTAEINEAIRIDHVDVNVAHLQADLLAAEAQVKYWRDAFQHCLAVKGGCSCQGRAEKLWCQRCKYINKFEEQTGEQCR